MPQEFLRSPIPEVNHAAIVVRPVERIDQSEIVATVRDPRGAGFRRRRLRGAFPPILPDEIPQRPRRHVSWNEGAGKLDQESNAAQDRDEAVALPEPCERQGGQDGQEDDEAADVAPELPNPLVQETAEVPAPAVAS